jgi:hypothetical protein
MKKFGSHRMVFVIFGLAGAAQLLPQVVAKLATYLIGFVGILALVYMTPDAEWSKNDSPPNRHAAAWLLLCAAGGALGIASLGHNWLSGFGFGSKATLGLLFGLAGGAIGALFAVVVILMFRAVPRRSE